MMRTKNEKRYIESKEDNSLSCFFSFFFSSFSSSSSSWESPLAEDENLRIHARQTSSLKWERVVLTTFFLFFSPSRCDSQFIIVRNAQKKIKQTRNSEREKEEKCELCVKQAKRLMRTNVLLNRMKQHCSYGKDDGKRRAATKKREKNRLKKNFYYR